MRHGGTPVVVSSSSTAESSSLEWESPVHGWHDLKKNKYKMALRNRYLLFHGHLGLWQDNKVYLGKLIAFVT